MKIIQAIIGKTMESAKILGKMVQALQKYDDLQEDGVMNRWFSREGLQHSIEILKNEYKQISPDNKYKERLEKDLSERIRIGLILLDRFDFRILEKMSILGTHGDFCSQQLIYGDDGEVTVIDFETAKKMPIVWEIMRSYSYIDEKAKNGIFDIKNLVDYFKEFDKFVKLTDEDLIYAPHIYLLQLVGSAFGYREYNRDSSQEELLRFGFFRTKLCKYLYQNMDKIGRKLFEKVRENDIEI